MTTLILRLAGVRQAWGNQPVRATRTTGRFPTKSGIVGMVAAAMGRLPGDPVDDLAGLWFGVRADRPGTMAADLHLHPIAKGLDPKGRMKYAENRALTQRYYLEDATFLAVLAGDENLIDQAAAAVQNPADILFLGRRSCPPTQQIFLAVTDTPAEQVLREHQRIAPSGHQARNSETPPATVIVRDLLAGDTAHGTERDIPLDTHRASRTFAARPIVSETVDLGAEEPKVTRRRPAVLAPFWAAGGNSPVLATFPAPGPPATAASLNPFDF